jgi:hypothetical protein
MGWMTKGLEFKSWYGQEFSLLHDIQTGSGAHPASYRMRTWAVFPGVTWLGREADDSTNTRVKKMWIYIFIPPYAFME